MVLKVGNGPAVLSAVPSTVVLWLGCLVVGDLLAGTAVANDWPHWRGPTRNGLVDEDSGYRRGVWIAGKSVWERNVGTGSTSPLVVGRRVYVMGWDGRRDNVYCLDAVDGSEIWKIAYPAPKFGRHACGDQGAYSAITSTPEYDPATGYLYTLSIDGDLNCWDTARRGRKVWGMNLYDRYRAVRRRKIGSSGQRDYGYTGSPLVRGETLIVEVGSSQGNLVGFDKRTGRQVWASESKDQGGHTGGPVPISVEGVPCVAVLTLDHLLVARLDKGREGKTVARYRWVTEFANNIASPAVHQNFVLITSGYNHNAICKLKVTLEGATRVWQKRQCSKVCSPVIYNGHVYWVWRRPVCLDFRTGELKWTGRSAFGDAGSCIATSDGRLIIWGGRGELVLAETADRSPGGYKELARKRTAARSDVWPHVVLCGGRLYCKDRQGSLKCFEVEGSGK